MTPTSSLPLVCPTCGGILHLTGALYSCSLHHRYTGQQLDDALAEQVRQTLRRTIQQLEQSQYLEELMNQRGLLSSVPNNTVPLELAHRLTKQLLTRITRPKA